MNYPFVSVIVPCRNEKTFINESLNSLLSNNYPKGKLEILVIDGASTDGTLEMVELISKNNPVVKILSNPARIFPSAVNIGVRNSSGEYLLIAGAHATYPEDYILQCIKSSIDHEADNTGGILETLPIHKSFIADVITRVLSNPFGVGNSRFRTGSDEITETDTVFGGCYKKNVFEKWGLFNENLVSTSDYEFNRRIKKNGAKILLIPSIRIKYYTRSTLSTFLKNNYRNGYWAIYPFAFTNHFPVSLRHIVPLFFSLTIISLVCLSFFIEKILVLFLLCGFIYLVTSFYFSFFSPGKKVPYILVMPLFFIGLHFIYGLGSIMGVAGVIKKKIF